MAQLTLYTPLVLASGSAIRAQMLKSVGLPFSVAPASVDEAAISASMADRPIEERAQALAYAKAAEIALFYPQHLTIGADQICAMGDVIFSKPGTREQAAAQLAAMQGQTHRQYSAVCLMQGEQLLWQRVEVASLTMRTLTEEEIAAYVSLDTPLQSCGSYKYESYGKHLFASVDGYDDVIKGLPLQSLLAELHRRGDIALVLE